jgi:hypothetical protein
MMTKAARTQLVKSILTSIVTYHTTVFPLSKWLIKKIDKQWWYLPSQMEHCLQAEGVRGVYTSMTFPVSVGPFDKGGVDTTGWIM